MARAPVHPVLQLQRTIGNQAVQRLVRFRAIQATPASVEGGSVESQVKETPAGPPAPPAPAHAPGFEGILTPNDNFTGRSKTRFGVGEVVNLSFHSVVSSSSDFFGGLKWFKESGDGSLTTGSDGTGTFTAGASAGDVRLTIKAGTKSEFLMDTKDIKVVAPTGAKMGPVSETFHVPGKWGLRFIARIGLRPRDVSFGKIKFQEGDSVAVATEFLDYKNGLHHCKDAGGTNDCSPQQVAPGDISMGSSAGRDSVGYTGEVPPEGKSFGPGTFKWRIPWKFIVGTSNAVTFMVAPMIMTSDSTGLSATSKHNILVMQGLNDAIPTITDSMTGQ